MNLVSIWCIFVRYSATVFKLEKVLNNYTIPMVNDNVVFKNSLVFKAVSIKTDNRQPARFSLRCLFSVYSLKMFSVCSRRLQGHSYSA